MKKKVKIAPPIQLITVRVPQLVEDPANPNKMTAEEEAALQKHIEMVGFVDPILVRPRPDGKFDIVDGHHRARCATRAGLIEIPAVLWDGTEEQRKTLAIALNKIRGQLDLSDVTKVFVEMTEHYGWSTTQLSAFTGYSAEEITDLLEASEFSSAEAEEVLKGANVAPDAEDDAPPEDRPLMLELTFSSSKDLKEARRGLKRAAGKGRELGEGLLNLLRGESDDA